MTAPAVGPPGAIQTVCCYCGVGCGVIVETTQTHGKTVIASVRGDPDHPANAGRLCSKGSTLHLSAAPHRYAQMRAGRPEMRATRDAPRHATTWDTALDAVADGFARVIERHGPDAVGIYISGQLLTEDYYVFNKLARAVIGTNNIDSNSRLCMSSAVMGYKTTLGADAPPCSYTDLDHAGTVFIAGANPAYAHPIVYRRLEDARARNPALRVIVADPRRTDSASDATLHLPLLPGTDVALFHGMLHVMLEEGLVDRAFIDAHTEGFASLRDTVRAWTPAATAETCGVPVADIVTAARWFAQGPTLSLYCQGLNQSSSGTAKNAALINLHLASAQIGKPGAGPFSLTGQPNAMGGREVGAMATLLSGHRDLASAADRAAVARLWGVPELPGTPGRTAIDMFDALRDGVLKAVWIVCTNPAQSLPDQPAVRAALARAELVVLQEAYAHTATAPFADILLPATTWAEKEGTMTNSERRVARVRAALPPFREARADWDIAADVARRLETRLRPGAPSLFTYAGPEAVWNEHRATTIGRDLDIGGLSWPLLDARGPQQWPFPAGAQAGQERLYVDHVFATPDGKARFADTPYRPVAEPTDTRYPFALSTGRLRDQWHGMSRTGTVEQLFAHAAEPCIDLHPGDLAALDLADGDLAHFTSRRGSTVFPVRANDAVRAGQAFMPMHWGEEFVSGTSGRHTAAGVNALTTGARDAKSHQPELKHAAVRILKAELAWHWFVFGFAAPDAFLTVQRALRSFMPSFPYASCVPFGRNRPGLLWRVAAYERPDPALQDRIEAMFGIDADSGNVLAYGDIRRGTRRRVKVTEGTLQAVAISGAEAATRLSAAWLREALEAEEPVPMLGRLLLMPGKRSMRSMATAPARGRTICSCVGVDAGSIARWLDAQPVDVSAGARLSGLQAALGCGTSCGSCVPELKRLAAASCDTAAAPST